MRHRVAGKKLNRNGSHRRALSRNLMRAMIIEWQGKGHIVTTRAKAKFIQPQVEKLITLAKTKSVHNIRRAMASLGDREVVQLLFDEIGPYYNDRPGGYTRILRLVKPRLGDASVRAYLGFVREDDEFPEGDRRAKAASEAAVTEEAPSESADSPASAEADSAADGVEETAIEESSVEDSPSSPAPTEEATAATGEEKADEEASAADPAEGESADEDAASAEDESAEEEDSPKS